MDGTLRANPPVAEKPALSGRSRLPVHPGRLLPRGVRATQVVLLLTVLVPLLMVQAGIYYSWFQTRRDAELEYNLELARAVAGSFDAYLHGILSQELAIGRLFASPESSPSERQHLLKESAGEYLSVRNYSWVSPMGQVLASSNPDTVGSDLAERGYFQDAIAGKEWVVSDLMVGAFSNQPTIAIARAARDERGKLEGVVLASIDATRLDSAAPIQRTGDASYALFDRQGILVYRNPDTPSWDERARIGRDPSVLKALAGEESTAIVVGADMAERFAARVPIRSLGWAAGASRSAAETMAPAIMDMVGYAVVSLLVALAATVAALVFGRRITAPLDRLRDHALAVGRGGFDHRAEPSGLAELVDLGDAFNRMADELRVREQGLRRSEADLRFLAEAGDVLAASLDYETTLTSVAHLVVPRMADWCVVDMADERGAVTRMVAVHADPAKQELMRELHRCSPDRHNSDSPIARVLNSGQPELTGQVSSQLLDQMADDRGLGETIRQLCPKSLMIVPLLLRGRTFGSILFASGESGRRYDSEDLALAELLAHRAVLAVDNARLYGEVQQAVVKRDEFFSVAAHELKTPITSLRGFAQLAIRQLDKEGALDPVRARQSLEVFDQQSKKLSSLVTQLLDVSRLEAGRLTLSRLMADVVALAESVVSSAQGGTTQHRLTFHAPASLTAFVDPIRLEQVLTNLVDNAVKYSPEGGEIAVDVRAGEDQTALISVRDHGIGIPPERRSRIFDRFYQAHSDSYFGGMGLGLYISRETVILHGGHIRAEFPEDGGTCFVVSLPCGIPGDSEPRGRME